MGRFIVILAILFSMQSCLHYDETLTLNKNGSGTVQIRFKFSKFLSYVASKDINKEFDKHEIEKELETYQGIKLLSITDYKENNRWVYDIKLSFEKVDNLRELNQILKKQDNVDMDNFFEDILVNNNKYERIIHLGNHRNQDDDVPDFIVDMVDLRFDFKVIYVSSEKAWSYNLRDLAESNKLTMSMKLTNQ